MLGAAAGDRQHHLVGVAGQAYALRFAGPGADLVKLRQFQHRGLRNTRPQEVSDGGSFREHLLAPAKNLDQSHTPVVGKPGDVDGDQVVYFRLADIEVLKLLNGFRPHARLVEGLVGAFVAFLAARDPNRQG